MTMKTTPAAILTVDDDPQVSRSVARDLRRRYGEHYQILRSESGADGLEVVRELSLRGVPVALLIVDYRMPGMSGIEFLEQAMDLGPAARRVLLTAYADSAAAIDAVNVVDLDHYLLKPWAPAEELLYPVLDDLLSDWLELAPPATTEMRVIGHQWCRRSAELREFLARAQASYRWFPVDQEDSLRLLDVAGADPGLLPVVITSTGKVLVMPSDTDVATELGLVTVPSFPIYDLVVVGAGPAGLGAAVYGASEGLRTLLVEQSAAGGQAGQSSRIENYLGFPDGISGAQLTERARRQAVKFGAELVTTREVVGLATEGGWHRISFGSNASVGAHAVILATGVSYRQLTAPGLSELTGRGVYYGASPRQVEDCVDQHVYIVGGANSAGQATVYFAHRARSVTLLVRGESLADSMSHYLIEQVQSQPNVDVRHCTEVVAASGGERLEAITIHDHARGSSETVAAGWLFIFIGAEPRTRWLDGVVDLDEHGFVLAGPDLQGRQRSASANHRRPAAPSRGAHTAPSWPLDRAPYHLETSLPGVFVAGDARAQSGRRVAAAVGEGATAVMLVHRYLARS